MDIQQYKSPTTIKRSKVPINRQSEQSTKIQQPQVTVAPRNADQQQYQSQPVKLEFYMQNNGNVPYQNQVNETENDDQGIGKLVGATFNNSHSASRQRRKRNQLYFSLNNTGQENMIQTNIQTINNIQDPQKSYETSSIIKNNPILIDQIVINGDLQSPNLRADKDTLGSMGSLLQQHLPPGQMPQKQSTISTNAYPSAMNYPPMSHLSANQIEQSQEYNIQSPDVNYQSQKQTSHSQINTNHKINIMSQQIIDPVRMSQVSNEMKIGIQNLINLKQQRLANYSYKAFGNLYAPDLIQEFLQPQDSIGFRQRSKSKKDKKDSDYIDKVVKDSYKTLIQVGNRKDNLKHIYNKFMQRSTYMKGNTLFNQTINESVLDKNNSELTQKQFYLQSQNTQQMKQNQATTSKNISFANANKNQNQFLKDYFQHSKITLSPGMNHDSSIFEEQDGVFQQQVIRNKFLKDQESPSKISFGNVFYSKHKNNFSEVDFSGTMGRKPHFILENTPDLQLKKNLQQQRQLSLQNDNRQEKIFKKGQMMNLSNMNTQKRGFLRSERLDTNSTYNNHEFHLQDQKQLLYSPAPIRSNADILPIQKRSKMSESVSPMINDQKLNYNTGLVHTQTTLNDQNIIEASSRRKKNKYIHNSVGNYYSNIPGQKGGFTNTATTFNNQSSQMQSNINHAPSSSQDLNHQPDYKSLKKTSFMGFKIPDLQASIKTSSDNLSNIKVDQLRSLKQVISIEQKLLNIQKNVNPVTTEKKVKQTDAENKFYHYVGDRIEMMGRMTVNPFPKKRGTSTQIYLY